MSGKKAHDLRGPISGRGGLATPVSMLIIFFSLTIVSTVTYYYAVSRVGAKKEDLKLVAAEEKMLDLEEGVSSTVWSPGSAQVLAFSDYGGELRVEPTGNHLEINVTMGASNIVVFNSSTGLVLYKMPFTISRRAGNWLRGDHRTIVNESSAHQAQVRIERGEEGEELRVGYRPLVSSSVGGLASGWRVNNIRVYIINLNGSQAFSSEGEFNLKVLCRGVSTRVYTYNLTPSVSSISIAATLSGVEEAVEAPITSGPSGSTVRVEVLVCQIELRRGSV